MTRKFTILAASLVAAFALATPAQASTVLFNPTGGGAAGALTIDLLDPAPGSSIVVSQTAGAVTPFPVGTVLTFMFQANLSVAKNSGSIVYTNGGGGNFFTIDAAKNEQVIISAANSATFGPSAGGTNVFNIWRHTVNGDDLSGTCFVSDCAGATLILSGIFLDNPATFSGTFATNPLAPNSALDQFNANNYPATQSVSGNGAFNAQIQVTSVNLGYFPSITVGSVLTFLTTSSNSSLPFTQSDPAACLSSNASTPCNVVGVASVGAVNGGAGNSRLMLETDAALSFQQVAVPEPATLTLLGLGLIGAAVARRRQLRSKQ